jgi:HTH-type transcriptional regulator / antitoxin MqsA
MKCQVCGGEKFRVAQVTETFRVNERLFVVEGIPADVCEHCGEALFGAGVAEQVRRLVQGPHETLRVLRAEVVAFRAA